MSRDGGSATPSLNGYSVLSPRPSEVSPVPSLTAAKNVASKKIPRKKKNKVRPLLADLDLAELATRTCDFNLATEQGTHLSLCGGACRTLTCSLNSELN